MSRLCLSSPRCCLNVSAVCRFLFPHGPSQPQNAAHLLLAVSPSWNIVQIWARAADGVGVPISLVYRKDQLRVGGEGMPALLEAYGAYGSPFPPYFNAGRISILDRRVTIPLRLQTTAS